MNLSLRTAGKLHAEKVPILEVLNNLLETENTQVRTYVNGTLYSVLTRPMLKEHAHAMGMQDILRSAMEHADDTFVRQIQYILEQLNASVEVDEAPSDDGDEEEDGEEEVDEDEEDDGEEDVADEPDADDRVQGLGAGPSTRPNRVLVCAARTLNATGQARVTLSPRYEQFKSGPWAAPGGKGA